MRLFLALKPPKDICTSLQELIDILAISNKRRNIRWTNYDNIHSTLLFMGDVKESLVPEIQNKLSKIGTEFKPFYAQFTHLFFLPNKKYPRVLALSFHDQSGTLKDLCLTLVKKLEKYIELKKNKKQTSNHKPHITLARLKDLKAIDVSKVMLPPQFFYVKEIVLIKSELLSFGPHYTDLYTYPFSP